MNSRTTLRTLLAPLLGAGLFFVGTAVHATPASEPASATSMPAPSPMRGLDRLKGVWSGVANGMGPDGKPFTVRQTERVGSMLNGEVLVIEGRGYQADGTLAFNAFGTVSADPRSGVFEFRAHTKGRSGTFRMEATPNGAVWELVAGPQAIVRYTITINNDTWHEVGEYIAKDQPPRKIIELTLKRTGDTDWPSANPVST